MGFSGQYLAQHLIEGHWQHLPDFNAGFAGTMALSRSKFELKNGAP
jgi:hypothetical protein